MSYDPSQNAARLLALQLRCLQTYPATAGNFTLAAAASGMLKGDHPAQPWFSPNPLGPRVAVAWSATYRGLNLRGFLLVADAALQDLAEAAALQSAEDELDLTDQKILRAGGGSGPFGVQVGREVPRPYYDPTLTGDARWVNKPTQGY